MKTIHKGIATPAAIAIIVLIVGAGIGVYFLGKSRGAKNPIPEVPEQVTQNQQNQNQTNSQTTPAKNIYRSDEDGFEVVLPDGFYINKSTRTDGVRDYSATYDWKKTTVPFGSAFIRNIFVSNGGQCAGLYDTAQSNGIATVNGIQFSNFFDVDGGMETTTTYNTYCTSHNGKIYQIMISQSHHRHPTQEDGSPYPVEQGKIFTPGEAVANLKFKFTNQSSPQSLEKILQDAVIGQVNIQTPQIETPLVAYSCNPSSTGGDVPVVVGERIINGKKYCIASMCEGAAGTTYCTYAYGRAEGNKSKLVKFTIGFHNCGGYGEPGEPAYENCVANQPSADAVATGLI